VDWLGCSCVIVWVIVDGWLLLGLISQIEGYCSDRKILYRQEKLGNEVGCFV
jgi:hypothetical protein